MKRSFCITATLIVIFFSTVPVYSRDLYSNFLKKKGFTAMRTPMKAFGTGTIIGKVGNLKDQPLATPEQCFPGIKDITLNEIELETSHQDKSLGINVGANYVPGGTSILGKILGAFKFNKVKNMDVDFGKTTEYVWTRVAFQEYLEGKTISRACYAALTSPGSKVIYSVAEVGSMTYTLNGDVRVGTNVDLALLNEALKVSGGVDYSNVTRNSLTVTSPMFIGYKAASFKDLKLLIPEAGADPNEPVIELTKNAFQLTDITVMPTKRSTQIPKRKKSRKQR